MRHKNNNVREHARGGSCYNSKTHLKVFLKYIFIRHERVIDMGYRLILDKEKHHE